MTCGIQSTDRITKQDTFGSVHSQTRLVQSNHRITRAGSSRLVQSNHRITRLGNTRLVQSIHRITRSGSTSLLGSVHSRQDHQIRQYTPGWFSPLTLTWFSPFTLAWFSPCTFAWLGPHSLSVALDTVIRPSAQPVQSSNSAGTDPLIRTQTNSTHHNTQTLAWDCW